MLYSAFFPAIHVNKTLSRHFVSYLCATQNTQYRWTYSQMTLKSRYTSPNASLINSERNTPFLAITTYLGSQADMGFPQEIHADGP